MKINESADRLPSSPYQAYLQESQKPIVCLVFALPFFLSYHVGVWYIHERSQSAWANGADIFLARALNIVNIGGPMISFFLVVSVFLFLQALKGQNWRVRPGTLALMVLESLIFALPPFLLGKLVTRVIDPHLPVVAAAVTDGAAGAAGQSDIFNYFVNIVLSVGAGVYEEFLFRMLIMGGLFYLGKRLLQMKGTTLYVFAVLTQAILFALFHHLPGSPQELTWEYMRHPQFLRFFAFRTVAGVYFAYLYRERGFGVTAGSHAFYDILAVTLNAAQMR